MSLIQKLNSLGQTRALEFNSNTSRSFSECLVNNKNFSFNVNKFASEWLKVYKKDFVNDLKSDFKDKININNQNISFDDYIVLIYFYRFILVDFFQILPFIPPPQSSFGILNIGAGIGYLDIILSKLYSSNGLNYYLIEKKLSKDDRNFDGSEHIMSKTISPLLLLKNNFIKNEIQNANFFDPGQFRENIKNFPKNINLVISIRSYCYLYGIDEYYDQLKYLRENNTFFILDVNNNLTEQFNEKFIPLKQIKKFKSFSRVLARLK